MKLTYYLSLSCTDQPGIVSAISSSLFVLGANILEAQQFDDVGENRFFMRVEFEVDSAHTKDDLYQHISPILVAFNIKSTLREKKQRQKVLILVSILDHCLMDLLYRYRTGELPMDLVAVVSNHPRGSHNLSMLDKIPFYHFSTSSQSKQQQEMQIKQVIDDTGAELVVLARYMQVLSPQLVEQLQGKCINIHHSFLPGFKGAKPYHQAHARGVKMIGATSHYVTSDLDEGPIIAQDVEPVSHADTADNLVRKGRDIERRVLAQAVHYHLEGRVLLNGSKTVVFKN